MLNLSQNRFILRTEFERQMQRLALAGICEAVRNMNRILRHRSLALRRGITALLIVQLLIVMAMSVSPQLHEWIHHDADADDHECAVTLFMHGGCDAPVAILAVAVFIAFVFERLVRPRLVLVDGLFLSRSVFEHAPPAFPHFS